MKRKLSCAVLLFFSLAAVSQALVIPTDYGSGADAYIGNDTQVRSTSTAGTAAAELRSRYNGGGSRFQCTYLRFDLSGMTNETFVGATLQLEATYIKSSTGRRLDVYGLIDESLDSWTESSLCYQNAPGMLQPSSGWDSGDYLLDNAKLVSLGFLTTPGTGGGTAYPIMFSSNTTDLGEAFSDFLALDTNKLVTLVIINATGTSSINCEDRFASKEHATFAAPALVLIPEPATLALLGLGSLIVLGRKGR
ncbi:MAG TPA: DNRLRE domain-containing protein [Anaerohalosphaeraceae bacterium]|jgi:hypothetical protein|nr:DNRLRE domain-containing protein [Anaerohalosphaeraceae bacterium]